MSFHHCDYCKNRSPSILMTLQMVLDFSSNVLQLLLLGGHGLVLLAQHFFHFIDIPVPDKIRNLRQRHIQGPQVADDI